MFARLYLWIIVSLLLLVGAVAAAPVSAPDLHAAALVEASVSGSDCVGLPGCAGLSGTADLVPDTPPLLTEMVSTGLAPLWLAAWAPTRTKAVVGILLFLPDEPPKRLG
ncbi:MULTISPECIES: hypothetical protein [unclassified Devosia]|uniref:hypothetical protein n=1 Tax=unclassified Devosia TaxID=196773 RepID=UPI00086B7BD2|nr:MULTISPECIES: hypothetical protein [unclassified Devosia]MBN9364273.1 hypothetical protein [Devosia sp.]ODS84195.1 MAG: hypothetical protein ABS47_19485 [Devosia sp. SCN 66-27]OJX27498.1 MAG: hypothetical protein BGO83_27445 [Devosia sp. 66-14]